MSKHEEVYKNTQKLCLGGILLSMAIVLSFAESAFPPLPFLPVGVKLGTANIITMYCLFFMGKRWAFSIAVLRSLFVVFTRGPVAGVLSLSGGIFSLAAIILFAKIFKGTDKFYLSIIGACYLEEQLPSILSACAYSFGNIDGSCYGNFIKTYYALSCQGNKAF